MKPTLINEKITIAKDLYSRWGAALRTDSGISAQLKELSARVEASSNFCLLSGVARACRLCDLEEGGSCCGAGIEDRYSPELLLINLLLGVTLPESRNSAKSCHFGGESGCVLAARDILCVNYLCARLQKTIPQEKLFQLQEANGSEMELLFLLHNRIRNFIRQKGT
jgi:hypothetical protein